MAGISKSKIPIYACLFFAAGIVIGSFFTETLIKYVFIVFLAALLCAVMAMFPSRNKKFAISALIGFFLLAGIWRYLISLPSAADSVLSLKDRQATIMGSVIAEPETNDKYLKYVLGNVRLAGQARAFKGKLLVYSSLFPRPGYGDRLILECKIQEPQNQGSFNYQQYLLLKDIRAICYFPAELEIKGNDGNIFLASIYKFKNKASDLIALALPAEIAGLGQAAVLGETDNISKETKDEFARSGLSHILAISGMNITIMVVILVELLIAAGLWRKQAFLASAVALILYLILICFPASAFRAGVMGFIGALAVAIGRPSAALRSLVYASFLMLIFNPKLACFDIGFQLSVLAVLGLIYFEPFFGYYLHKMSTAKIFSYIADTFSITLSAQLLTFPVLVQDFGQISLAALPANLSAVWMAPFLIFLIPIAIISGFIWPPGIRYFFIPSFLLLSYLHFIAKVFSKIPVLSINVNQNFWIIWMLYYITLFFVYKKIKLILSK